MNRAHRIADQFRSVVGWLGRVPTESQFITRGFLTPAEFVEAGDQLVFQCPTWQWQSCPHKKHQVFWLPANKQFLLTRNIPCRHRVHDWEKSFCKQAHVTSEGWLVPGPQPSPSGVSVYSGNDTDNVPSNFSTGQFSCGPDKENQNQGDSASPQSVRVASSSPPTQSGGDSGLGGAGASAVGAPTHHRIVECKLRTADGAEFAVRHDAESSSNSEGSYVDDDEGAVGPGPVGAGNLEQGDAREPYFHKLQQQEESATGGDDFVDVAGESSGPPIGVQARLANIITRGANQFSLKQSGAAPRGCLASGSRTFAIEEGEFTVILNNNEEEAPPRMVASGGPSNSKRRSMHNFALEQIGEDDDHDAAPNTSMLTTPGRSGQGRSLTKGRRHKGQLVPTRSYDLSITYDKYYQSPRLWLFGYDESGVPLRSNAVFEDIHADYLSKTVTVDPHPFTGVPTVSVHPCKHASVMRAVAQNWLKAGMQPRHDLALFVLLKMVASVVPTINYDFTIDIEMPIGLTLPVESVEEEDEDPGGILDHSR